jgi:ATP-dependent RNA helicase DeaD
VHGEPPSLFAKPNMKPSNSGSNPFTNVIDFTSRAQREKKDESSAQAFAEPDPPLPPATLDDLPANIRKAVETMGWPGLMPVQERAIPYMLEPRDIIVQSRTGSGKTGAFLLPILTSIDPAIPRPQALVLTPTRELARQVDEEFQRMTASESDEAPKAALIYGGVRYGPQLQSLRDGAQLVIGTPGRILDHLERKNLDLSALKIIVFDEADEMLSMGFYPAMKELRRWLPRERNSFMFSATIPPRVQGLAREFLYNPGFLSLSVGKVAVDAIEHRYHVVDAMAKDRALARIIEMENPDSAIIFCNTKRDVEYVATFLRNYGYDADEISGDLSQAAREKVMSKIRTGTLRFLVATDVAARGIDISDLSHVFMYDVPQDPEYYVHRSGRTARAGKSGVNVVLVTSREESALKSITRKFGIDIEKQPVPSEEDVSTRVSERMMVLLEERLRDVTNLERERMQRFLPLVKELAAEEPEALALLVDRLYHESLHHVPETASVRESHGEAEEPRRDQGGRSKRKPRRKE